eukprot:TRINITY_DN2753_c0_g1_i1.p1 TRINITY_DN2753_c0_g1~~TRINITY_DN2753_c0_g1_i1.p1  ORF type:complete len:792 (-),score=185.99 TRINITY_DN2753_c0_g1_i1:248-2623(-)
MVFTNRYNYLHNGNITIQYPLIWFILLDIAIYIIRVIYICINEKNEMRKKEKPKYGEQEGMMKEYNFGMMIMETMVNFIGLFYWNLIRIPLECIVMVLFCVLVGFRVALDFYGVYYGWGIMVLLIVFYLVYELFVVRLLDNLLCKVIRKMKNYWFIDYMSEEDMNRRKREEEGLEMQEYVSNSNEVEEVDGVEVELYGDSPLIQRKKNENVVNGNQITKRKQNLEEKEYNEDNSESINEIMDINIDNNNNNNNNNNDDDEEYEEENEEMIDSEIEQFIKKDNNDEDIIEYVDEEEKGLNINFEKGEENRTRERIELNLKKINHTIKIIDKKTNRSFEKMSIVKRLILLALLLIVMSGVAFVICILIDGMCLPQQPTTVDFSTRFYRNYILDDFCDTKKPCHTYLLLASQPFKEMIIVFHTKTKPDFAHVLYGTSPNNLSSTGIGTFKYMSHLKQEIERYVCRVHLTNLSSNKKYYFQTAHNDNTDHNGDIFSFKTLPYSKNEQFNFVVAGDIGNSDIAHVIGKQIALENPYFIAVGGDVFYEDCFITCHRRVDNVLHLLSNLTTASGRIIPFTFAIGNHDANNFRSYNIDYSPFFFHYFPFELETSLYHSLSKTDFYREEQKVIFFHIINQETILINLDTNVLNTASGFQRTYLEAVLNTYQSYTRKLVMYHCPMYPVISPLGDILVTEIRNSWLDLFDKYGVDIAFEHHDHSYKRTYKLKGGAVNKNGTVYIGDGAWGVELHVATHNINITSYTKFAIPINYYLHAFAQGDQTIVYSKEKNGHIFDSFEI